MLREAARRLALLQSGAQLPIFLPLRGYRGSLHDLAAANGAGVAFTAAGVTRVYLLDGLDEVAQQHRAQFTTDLTLLLADPTARTARCIVTARQAFFGEHADLLPTGFLLMHLLGFGERGKNGCLAEGQSAHHDQGDYDSFHRVSPTS